MRIDIVTIFPEYFSPLSLSLIGKAQTAGRLTCRVHELRDFATDRHRTVDDTPYGGGAGMVMLAEPWARALETVGGVTPGARRPTLIVPTPAGTPFTQAEARELAQVNHLLLACGRYEGIDERLLEWAAEQFDVRLLSIGDYIVGGGEVAGLVVIEAVARLLPGVLGNPESLAEESHEDGLLEYPVYTRPTRWRQRPVPEVLLSGHHARIEQYRREQQLRRTAQRRPDMLARYLESAQITRQERQILASGDGEGFDFSGADVTE